MRTNDTFILDVTCTDKTCAAGEKYGRTCQEAGKIPVFSCEGGCIKGEIARQAANLVAKDEGYARACHGELFTVPHADFAKWVWEAEKVVLIDGCSLFCQGRIARNIIGEDRLIVFDALSIHKKYRNLMDVDDVPDEERMRAAREVAERVLAVLGEGAPCRPDQQSLCECGTEPLAET
jgi:uncharacterized metal-binding protein